MSPDDLYLRLGEMVARMPALDAPAIITREVNEWLGQTYALVELIADVAERASMSVAMQHLNSSLRASNAQAITSIVFTALARAALRASPSLQGNFIPAGSPHQAFVAVGSVIRAAKQELLIVDPYASSTALSDFAIQAAEGVRIRLLADAVKKKSDLEPAILRWKDQYADVRPLSVAFAQPPTLHDRLIVIDDEIVWSIGQSLNGIGKNSPTAIFKIPTEAANEKIAAYRGIWNSAEQS